MKKRELLIKLLENKKSKTHFQKQEEYLWFSICFLSDNDIKNALNNILEKRKHILSRVSSLFLIPHVYIFPLVFGGMWLNAILSAFYGTDFLFWNDPDFYKKRFIQDIILYFCLFLILGSLFIKVFRQLSVQMGELSDALYSSKIYKKNIISLISYRENRSNWAKLRKKRTTWFENKTFIFFFSQPFIFWHGLLFWGFSVWALVVFDIFIYLILFNKLKEVLFLWSYIYFKIKFYIFQTIPILGWKKFRQRNIHLKLYNSLTDLNAHLSVMHNNVEDVKKSILNKDLWLGLKESIKIIKKSYFYINNKQDFFAWDVFQKFLIEILNESIDEYVEIFNELKNIYSQNPKVYGDDIENYIEKLEYMKHEMLWYKI